METQVVFGRVSAVGQDSEPVQIIHVNSRTVAASNPVVHDRLEPPSHLVAGLFQLLRAFDYAADVGRDVWDFAIELSELRNAGITTCDFRWLVSKGFAQHGQENSLYGAPHRCFCPSEGLTFLATSTLVLTSQGAAELRKLLTAAGPSDLFGLPSPSGTGPRGEGRFDEITELFRDANLPRLPHDEKTAADRLLRLPLDTKPAWDARRRELRVGDFLVKRFRVPAENQSLVLSAFEEEGWPAYIDDPLPMKSKIVPKQRLHNAITRLNGSQLVPILRFHGNGNGDAIGWQLLPRHALHEANGIDRDSAVAESDQRHQSAATPCPRH